MRILVTGATGFVGSHVVEALLAREHEVVGLVRDPRKARHLFGERVPELVEGDLRDPAALRRACATVEAVAHVAGLTAARGRGGFLDVNAGGTRALAEAASAAGPDLRRFVHVSSLAAAGPAARGKPLEEGEDEGPGPVSRYGASKLAGEAPVRGLTLDWTILRPPAVYGPRDRELLRLFRAGRFGLAPFFGDGSQELSLVYATDLADAVVACLEARCLPGVFYPSHREVWTTRGLARTVAQACAPGRRVRDLPVPRAIVRPLLWLTGGAAWVAGRATLLAPDKAGEILAEAWTCSPDALERLTGWRARTDLAEGLRRTAKWYRAAGWL